MSSMAMMCINACRECNGCGVCEKEYEKKVQCKICQRELEEDDIYCEGICEDCKDDIIKQCKYNLQDQILNNDERKDFISFLTENEDIAKDIEKFIQQKILEDKEVNRESVYSKLTDMYLSDDDYSALERYKEE